jgi:hypothetical protein
MIVPGIFDNVNAVVIVIDEYAIMEGNGCGVSIDREHYDRAEVERTYLALSSDAPRV